MDAAIIRSVVLTILLLVVCSGEERFNYASHKVIEVIPQTNDQVQHLLSLAKKAFSDEVNFWRYPRDFGSPVFIRLAPSVFEKVCDDLKFGGFKINITIDNVQEVIDKQLRLNQQRVIDGELFEYGKYHTLQKVNKWITNITNVYSSLTTVFNITTSYEGRNITAFKISTGKGPSEKSGFWLEGGIHAREWISPATVIYMAGQMLDQYGKDDRITKMVDMFDWYILPVFNVDGYEYTWTTKRDWRKTRSKQGKCYGVDPNRNWDVQWCEKGASKEPCSEDFCGPSAFSEVEVKGVANYITALKNVKGFIDFHSFSQLWMSPYGYTKAKPKDYNAQIKGSKYAVAALEKVYGTKYQYGTIANIIYEASGSSADWTYDEANIIYSYGVELRDTGKYGFLLPPDQIIPSGKETLEAVIALAEYVYNN